MSDNPVKKGDPDKRRRPLGPRPPVLLVVAAVVASVVLVVPFAGLLGRTPWRSLPSLLSQRVVLDALVLSLFSSVVAMLLSLVLGLPLAYVLARLDFPGRTFVRALVTLPMVLPPVVGGVALLFALGRRGLLGAPLYELTGFSLPFTIWGVVIANTFVAMPFLVVTVEGALSGVDQRQIDAAASLGASEGLIFRRIMLPAVAGSVRAGALLAWARALGEFGATITFAGNLQGRTQTLPLAVYVALESDRGAAVAMSLVLIAISLSVLIVLRHRWWRVL